MLSFFQQMKDQNCVSEDVVTVSAQLKYHNIKNITDAIVEIK